MDDGTNRNQVTLASHGYLTRDGVTPQQLRELGLAEVMTYPSVSYLSTTLTEIQPPVEGEAYFVARDADDHSYAAEKVILATGIQEIFPIEDVKVYYGKSLFSCPYCDGWEHRDQPLMILAEKENHVLHLTKLVYQWSKDLIVFTNGHELSAEAVQELQHRQLVVRSEPVKRLIGTGGYLEAVELASGERLARSGGFVAPSLYRPNQFAEGLGCEIDDKGRVVTDGHGRTTRPNVYIAGEARTAAASSLSIAAAEGHKAAASVNVDFAMERF